MSATEVEWRRIPSAPSYEVSNFGAVRSWLSGTPYLISVRLNNRGRPTVSITEPKPRRVYVHVLVAEAFIGPRPDRMDVCHIDGDRRNNSVANLRYGTRSQNELDKVAHGQHNHARKTHCIRDHEFTPDNTQVFTAPNGRPGRRCRACAHLRATGALKKSA